MVYPWVASTLGCLNLGLLQPWDASTLEWFGPALARDVIAHSISAHCALAPKNAEATADKYLAQARAHLPPPIPTRMSAYSPPPYSPVNEKQAVGAAGTSSTSDPAPAARTMPRAVTTSLIPESQLSALKGYDIVYLVDDSSLMAWREKVSGIIPWPSARDALVSFSNLCSEWDEDGQDIYFINRAEGYMGCTPSQIAQAFDSAPPRGLTNMGRKLQQVAYEYFKDFDPVRTKPVNVIAITDGEFTDDVETVVRWIVKNLEKKNALANSFGIQFVQIGADVKAKKHLEYLDDNLSDLPRDIVDTVPWLEHKVDGRGFDGKYLLKAVCGAINKKLDNDNLDTRKKSGGDRLKRPGTFRRLFGRS